ncbi:MAG: DUF448 domain-containing protein [Acidobacteriota bacterium]|nr:DUF448 domain-containing protein [Acidobacteriota bacterium]
MVCRRRREWDELQRAGRSPDGGWYLGPGAGRGVWWCREGECLSGVRATRVARALRRPLDESDVAGLRELAQRSKTVVVVEE